MTKQHKEKENGAHTDPEAEKPEDERLFDFDKSVPEEGDSPGSEADTSSEELAELKATVQELKDKHLRLLAEFDNYKKRTMRERLDLLNSASRDVMLSLLPVLDDFDRAKKSADDPKTDESFSEGVLLVYNRFSQILQGMGLRVMNSNGESFDPELHEAITEIPAPDESMKGKIIDTIEKGYMLHEKIIRHAKVVVGN